MAAVGFELLLWKIVLAVIPKKDLIIGADRL